jgi:uncharacterized protein
MYKEGKIIEYNDFKFPILTISGKGEGPITVITAGIHACEYSPINALYRLYDKLIIEKSYGKIILIPIVDIKGFEAKKMYVCPVDNKNINRVFPGKEEGSYSERLIYYIFNEYIIKADYYIDMHCADLIEDMIPFIEIHESGNEEINMLSRKMANYYGIEDITIKKLKGIINDEGQSYSSAVEAGIPSILANAGKIGDKRGELIHFRGLNNLLKYTGNLEGKSEKTKNIIYYKPPVHIKSKRNGLFFSFVEVGNIIKKGDIIGKIMDYTSQKIHDVKAPIGGKVLLKSTATAVKEGSLLLEILVKL